MTGVSGYDWWLDERRPPAHLDPLDPMRGHMTPICWSAPGVVRLPKPATETQVVVEVRVTTSGCPERIVEEIERTVDLSFGARANVELIEFG